MRAIRFDTFGPTPVLKVAEVEDPVPGAGQVRVAVKAAGVNPIDSKQRLGLLETRFPTTLPSGIGRELAGVVDQVGEGVTHWKQGDEVFGCVDGAAIAQFAIADAANLAPKPHDLDWTIAGGLALTGQTAHASVASQHPRDTDTVLVSAAAGGVGVIAAQLVKRTGATVIGTASEQRHRFLRDLGIIPVAYGPGLADRVRKAAPAKVTIVLDNHGVETVEAGLELGVDLDRINSIAHVTGYGIKLVGRGPANVEAMKELARLAMTGDLVVPVEAVYPLEDVAKAYEHLERGHSLGKIVVTI